MKKGKQKKGGWVALNDQEAEEKLIQILNANFKEDEIEVLLARKEPMSPEKAALSIKRSSEMLNKDNLRAEFARNRKT